MRTWSFMLTEHVEKCVVILKNARKLTGDRPLFRPLHAHGVIRGTVNPLHLCHPVTPSPAQSASLQCPHVSSVWHQQSQIFHTYCRRRCTMNVKWEIELTNQICHTHHMASMHLIGCLIAHVTLMDKQPMYNRFRLLVLSQENKNSNWPIKCTAIL